jgi:hypothetical protein
VTVAEELASVLQGVDDLTYLGQEKGSIRFLGMLGVLIGRECEERVQNDVVLPFFSYRSKTRVSPSFV